MFNRRKNSNISHSIDQKKLKRKQQVAKNRAGVYLKNKDKLKMLIQQAEEKAWIDNKKNGFVKESWNSLKTMVELVKAYVKGDYRNIPYRSLLLIVGAIVYFVMPVDTIPDFLAGLGFTDDAAVLAFTLKQVKEDVDKFLLWKKEQEHM